MKALDFIQRERPVLAKQLEAYLAQRISHFEIQRHIDGVFESWEHVVQKDGEPYSLGENEFWCAVWATQHLASEDHWVDGIAQRELGLLQRVLDDKASLPAGYEGKRP